MKTTFLPILGLGLLSLLMPLSGIQYANAAAPSVSVQASFATCCFGFLQIQGFVQNANPGVNKVYVQVYAPNNQLVLNHSVNCDTSLCGHFHDGFGISRDQGKGDYKVIVSYLKHFSAQTEVPSWINNDPVVVVTATEFSDGSAVIQGRIDNGIAGEQVSIVVQDYMGSTTATFTQATNTHAQFTQNIDSTEARTVFPSSGDYAITVTHNPTGVSGRTTLAYTVPSCCTYTDG
jgi:hypothetical protein